LLRFFVRISVKALRESANKKPGIAAGLVVIL